MYLKSLENVPKAAEKDLSNNNDKNRGKINDVKVVKD